MIARTLGLKQTIKGKTMTNTTQKDEFVATVAGHALNKIEIVALVELLAKWVNKTDTTGQFRNPNGSLWNAVGLIVNKRTKIDTQNG